jgi:G:T-mismatch repair DNA endonuclease (very short patch repair protein)
MLSTYNTTSNKYYILPHIDYNKKRWNCTFYKRVEPYSFNGHGGKWWIQYQEAVPSFKYLRDCISKKLDIQKNRKGCSKAACMFLDILSTSINTYIRHQLNNEDGEYKITGTQKRADGYIERYKSFQNIIVEYHGCYWHGCKKCHPNKMIRSRSSEDLYNKTSERTRFLREIGYIVVEVWECEVKQIKDFVRWFECSLENKTIIKTNVFKISMGGLFDKIINQLDSIVNCDLLELIEGLDKSKGCFLYQSTMIKES